MRQRRETVRVVAACLAALGGAVALPAQTRAAGQEALSGTYEALHVDKIPGGRRVDVLVSNGKAYEVRFAGGTRPRAGARVRVTGDVSGDTLTASGVEQLAAAPAAAAAAATRRVLVIDVTWNGQPLATTQDTARAFVFGTSDPARRSVAQYYQDVSYGQLAVTGDVTPTLTIADPGGCSVPGNVYAIADAADQAAASAGYVLSNYDSRMYNLPAQYCSGSFGGLGEVAGSRIWVVNGLASLDSGYARMIPTHELGHNLGLWHAHGLECGAQVVTPACLASPGSVNEYGHSFDLMGNGWSADDADAVNWLSFPSLLRLGWLGGRYADAADPGGAATQDFTVAPVERDTGSVGLRITTAARVYYVEYRQPLSQDSFLTRFPDVTSGVLISMRNDASGGDDGQVNLDTSPSSTVASPYSWNCPDLTSYCDFFDAALNAGETFTDVDGRFTLSVTSTAAGGATVHLHWLASAGPGGGENWAANPSVDFDGDHLTDLGALYRGLSPDSLWYAPGTFQIHFAATADVPVPGDYDGDGKTDAVIYRPATGLWYGPRTGAAQIVLQLNLGQPGDVPIPGDYDGDGKTDPAIYRPSTGLFFALLSGGGTASSTFGAPGDVPVPRDYDGDGRTDFGIYRADATPDHLGLWYAQLSGGGAYQIYFGAPGDVPVPGDYNGDRRAEAVIFRPSTGLWYGPYNGATGLFQLQLGQSGDVPIPGYYDADTSMDPAIYRKSTGLWFAEKSGGGVARVDGLGLPTDVPVQKRPALAGGT